MRTIVYGGAFTPTHDAHHAATELALSLADRVVIVPSGQRRDKPSRLADTHRIEMLRIMVTPFGSRVEVCTDMLDLPPVANTTANVDRILRARYGDGIEHIFGTDTVGDMPGWSEPDYIAEYLPKVFIRRADDTPDLRRLVRWRIVEPGTSRELRHLSSTLVRESVRQRVYRGVDPHAETYMRFHGIDFL